MKLPDAFEPAGDHLAIDLPGARAVFTTRRGGFSAGPYATLNLGLLTDDDSSAVERNRSFLAAELGVRFAYGRQIHGATVHRATEPHHERGLPAEADGQASATPGVGVMVLTADCLPIAVAGEGAVAILHAGWRGLSCGVIAEGVRALRELGATGELGAAIGPGAGPCCYKVTQDMRAIFPEAEFADAPRPIWDGRNLDLKAIAAAELARAGVQRIHDIGLCTICSTVFFSHRRDRGITGRQAGVAWLS